MLDITLKAPKLYLAIIRTSSLGDIVLASACLDYLDRSGLDYELTWIGRGQGLQLLKEAYPKLRIINFDSSQGSSLSSQHLKELASTKLLIDLQGNLRSRKLSLDLRRRLKIPLLTIPSDSLGRSGLVLRARLRPRFQQIQLEDFSPRYQVMVETIHQSLSKHWPGPHLDHQALSLARPHLPTSHDLTSRSWQKELKFRPWISIAPGALYPPKRAPLHLFARILQELKRHLAKNEPAELSPGLLILGSEAERELALRLQESLEWPYPVLNLCGKTSLWESALALKDSKVLICNDSSLGHIAESVGTPVCVLFGPTVEAFGFRPWSPKSRSYSVQLGCRPCSKHGDRPCRFKDQLCFEQIDTKAIAQHLLQLLSPP